MPLPRTVLVDPGYEGDMESLMHRIHRTVREEFSVQHVTLQMETTAADCSERHHVDHLQARTLSES